jgi:hypothetical protein
MKGHPDQSENHPPEIPGKPDRSGEVYCRPRKTVVAILSEPNSLLALAALGLAIVNTVTGDILPVRGGFGWDGLIYKDIARNFPEIVLDGSLYSYYVARSIPSLLVHYGIELFQKPLENDYYILAGFQVYNLILLLGAVFVWGKVTDELKLGRSAKWLAFIGLFVNYAIFKKYFYAPVETDPTAFFLGILLLYFFLKDNVPGLLAVTIAGAFTWPVLLYYGLLLYVFPRSNLNALPSSPRKYRPEVFLASSVAGAVLIALIVVYVATRYKTLPYSPTIHSVVYLSILITVAYEFFAVKTILESDGLYDLRSLLQTTKLRRVVVALLIFLSCSLVPRFLGQPNPEYLQPRLGLGLTVLSSIQQPAVFLVAHAVFFGPIVILTALMWKQFCGIIHQYGAGVTLLILMNVVLGLASQSRFLLAAFPFFVAFTAKAVEGLKWGRSRYWVFGVISFLASKIWLRTNLQSWTENSPILEFPAQYLFMNAGPWMSIQMYIVQGCAALLVGLILFAMVRGVVTGGGESPTTQLGSAS